MRLAIALLLLTTAVATAEPYTGDFATDGVFDASPSDTRVVRNHLELAQTGAQIRGRLVVDGAPIGLTGTVSATGAALVIGGRTFPIRRIDGGLELSTGNKTYLFKRAPSITPLPTAVVAPGAASSGAKFSSPWGWSLSAPNGWTTTPRGGGVLLEGERIAIYTASPRISDDVARDALTSVFRERGGEWQLMPIPAMTKLGGATAEVLEIAGFDDDEVEWRARVIAVSTQLGIVTVTGVARIGELATLRTRVDEVARSARIAAPSSPEANRVIGEWWSFERMSRFTGSGGTTYTISLCADGRFIEINETSGVTNSSLNTPGVAINSKTTVTGRWIAAGSKIHVDRDDGKTSEIAYRVAGNRVAFGRGEPYFRKNLGRCTK